jgi:4-amino-4-deoxy-L-arabinose transferase-like glycosyltransferase
LDADCPPIEDRSRRTPRRLVLEGVGIVALSLALNLAGNDRVGLWDRDEPRYAACTREMRERGDWLHPTFNGQPRYHKPILIYWLMRGGYAVGGDNPFGARLVSGIAGALTCLLAWRLGRSMLGPEAGLLTGLALATVPIMVAESKLATTDATLALLVVVAQGCLWGLSRGNSWRLVAGFWLAMALATLLKGPVGPALVAVSGVVSWWWGGPTVCWRRVRRGWGLVLFLAVTTPWFVAVGVLSHGEFFRFVFRTQIVQRMATGMEQHGGFPGYYPVAALAMFYPWSTLLPAALLAGWTRRRISPEFGFLLGWIVGPWLLLECFGTKLIHYYLPSFPACALLVSWLVVEVARNGGKLRDWPLGYLAMKLLGGMALIASGALIVAAWRFPSPLLMPCLAMVLVLAVGTCFARVLLARGDSRKAARRLVITWAVVMGLFVAWFLPSAEPFRFSRVVGERLGELSRRTGVRPAMMTFQEPGLIYALGHPACDVRGYDEMAEEVRERGPILLPLLAKEIDEIRDDPRFVLDLVEPISGFNANKGKTQDLTFAVVGPAHLAASRPGQQPLVK